MATMFVFKAREKLQLADGALCLPKDDRFSHLPPTDAAMTRIPVFSHLPTSVAVPLYMSTASVPAVGSRLHDMPRESKQNTILHGVKIER